MKVLVFVTFFLAYSCTARRLTQQTLATASASVSTTNGTVTSSDTTTSTSDGTTKTSTTESTTQTSSGSTTENEKTTKMADGATAEEEATVNVAISIPSEEEGEESFEKAMTPRLDVYILADTTVGMKKALVKIQNKSTSFIRALFKLADKVRVGVGEYKDVTDDVVFRNILSLQTNKSVAIEAINMWNVSGGGRTRMEAQLFALETIATNASIRFRQKAKKVVVWMGNQRGQDPARNSTEKSATSALKEAGIQVIAIDVHKLNERGQATRIVNATDGLYRMVKLGQKQPTTVSSETPSSSATASGSGDNVVVKTSAGNGNATAKAVASSARKSPTIPDVIIDAVETLLESEE